MILRLFRQDFRIRINDFGPKRGSKTVDSAVDLLKLAGEVAGRAGDGGDAQGGTVPDDALVEFGDGKVEAVAELVLHGAEDLTAVFEGLGVRDFKLDNDFGDGHFQRKSMR
jgi:hypothetical protein